MLPHVPSVPLPFFVAVQAWQFPVHAASQQTPSVQNVDKHCVPNAQALPFGCAIGAWLQAPDPLHSPGVHSLSGSFVLAMGPQDPSAP
jgi:hypothetical protein